MMRAMGGLAFGTVLTLGIAWGADPGPAIPADFKLLIASYGIRPEPIATAELIVRKGRAYRFDSESRQEVIIYNPPDERLVLLDLDRKIQSEVMLEALDGFRKTLHDAIAAAIRKRERAGGRANKVSAAMSRDLIEPRFHATFDAANHRLHLTNPSVTVEAVGVPDPDPARRALTADTLAASITLEAMRDPKAIPPFPRLDALKSLTADHALRPVEVTIIYRLAGPPQKSRWTYRLVTALTAREEEALALIEAMRDRARFVPFDRYKQPTPKPPG